MEVGFFFEYDAETKRRSEEWHTTQPPEEKKVLMSK
jgi:hypothetical protein